MERALRVFSQTFPRDMHLKRGESDMAVMVEPEVNRGPLRETRFSEHPSAGFRHVDHPIHLPMSS